MKKLKNDKSIAKGILLTSASFTGYNIGSGFATGTEALQFFASWGRERAFIGMLIAFAVAMIVLISVYVTGYKEKFKDDKQVYRYFCGKHIGVIFDYYIYISMILITLTLMSGAGATINQLSGLPTYIGTTLMGILCIITSLLGIEKMKRFLSYMCIFIIIFILGCSIYVFFLSDLGTITNTLNRDRYIATGEILQTGFFGITNPYLSGFASAGMLIVSGFAWASSTGTLCKNKKEAMLSGVFSSLFFYVATSLVVYLLLVSMDIVAGKEVPMLAVVQYFLPELSAIYSCIIILAIFSTISGRLFSIGERFGKGNKKLTLLIVTSIIIIASVGSAFISFSKISNFMFSICGAVGIILGIIVLIRFYIRKPKNNLLQNHFTATGIVLNAKQQILMIYHNKLQVWLPPGGHVEPNEIPDNTVLREIFEETGIKARIINNKRPQSVSDEHSKELEIPFVVLLEDITGNGLHNHIDLIYLCEALNDDYTPQEAEVSGIGWFTLDQIKNMKTFDNVINIVSQAIDYIN